MLGAPIEHRHALLVLSLALGVQLVHQLADPRSARRGSANPGEPIAARFAIELVFGRVDLCGLLEDLPRQLLIGLVRKPRRVRRDLGRIDRNHPSTDQPGALTHRQHLPEQLAERLLMLGPKRAIVA